MPYDPARPNRQSIRLKGWDYAGAGAYFITLCTHQREALFGEIVGDEMRLNEFGRVAAEVWAGIPDHFSTVTLDAYVVMPNHIHGVLIIVPPTVGATHASPLPPDTPPNGPRPGSIGAIVGAFKSAVTKRVNEIRQTPGVSIWQRNYYEHIVRTDRELNAIRRYIQNNPAQWALDRDNAGNVRRRPAPRTMDDYLADLPADSK